MTLLVLFLSVVFIAGLLWVLKDYWAGRREGFENVQNTDLLGLGYAALSPSYQQQANETEPITEPVLQQAYQQDSADSIQRLQGIQQATMAELNAFPMVPIQPAEQVFAAAQVSSGTGTAGLMKDTAADAADAEYQRLVERRDRSLLESCYQDSCSAQQAEIENECRTFNEDCHIRHADNIHLCLKSLNEGCNRSLLDKCRDTCMRLMRGRSERSSLTQEEVLNMNERLMSPSGSTALHLNDEGGLELWKEQRLLWKIEPNLTAASAIMGPYKMLILSNGDLVIKNGANNDIWHTNTWLDVFKGGSANAPYKLTVGEGEITLINKNGDVLWKK